MEPLKEHDLIRISHYLFVLDTYLFGQAGREDQREEIKQLQKAITATIQNAS